MVDIAGTLKRGRVPAGFLGMLGIVLLVESFVASRPILFADVVRLNRRFSVEAASRFAAGRDVLLLGDSLVKLGLVPGVIGARSGRSAFNLAAASGPAPSTYFVLRRALESGAKPGAVVVDFGPGLLAAGPERDVGNSSEVLRLRESLDLAWTARSVPFLASFLVRWALPSVRCRNEIRGLVRAAWRGEDYRQAETNRACRRNWQRNDGAHIAAANPNGGGDDGPPGPDSTTPGRLHVHRVNRDYVGRIFALAASRGIRVYWLLPPESPRSQASRKRRGVVESYTKFAGAMQARHPEVTILDARRSGYDRSVFFDPVHLDVRGAVALSTSVADRLVGSVEGPASGPRWVALPRPDTMPPGPLPEDLEQSKMALRAAVESSGTVARVASSPSRTGNR